MICYATKERKRISALKTKREILRTRARVKRKRPTNVWATTKTPLSEHLRTPIPITNCPLAIDHVISFNYGLGCFYNKLCTRRGGEAITGGGGVVAGVPNCIYRVVLRFNKDYNQNVVEKSTEEEASSFVPLLRAHRAEVGSRPVGDIDAEVGN